MTLSIAPIYASLITLIFLFLSARVIVYRRKNKLSVGDAGDQDLLKRMRTQANCAEYAPFGLLLIVIIELLSAPGWLVHLAGTMLLAGRIAHAIGFGSTPQIMRLRVLGMIMTLSSFLVCVFTMLAISVTG